MNDIEKMTLSARQAMQNAVKKAEKAKNTVVEPEHLLCEIFSNPTLKVTDILKNLQVESGKLNKDFESQLKNLPQITTGQTHLTASPRLAKLFKLSENYATELGDQFISCEHFLVAASKLNDREINRIFSRHKINEKNLHQSFLKFRQGETIQSENPESQYKVLEKYTRDLTELASQGELDPVIGRNDEIRRTIQVLARRKKNNPVLIGEPGVGKTAIAEGLALRIISKDVPEVLNDKKILSLGYGILGGRNQIPGGV